MNFGKLASAALSGALLAGVAAAQEAAPPVKLGFVDVEKAVVTIDEGKARLKELQDWARPRQEEIGRISSEISNLQGELQSKRGAATEAALGELNRRIVARQRELEDKQRIAKREFDERQNTVLRDLGGKLNAVITEFADTNRFTAVFILKPNEIAYLAHSADITDEVIRRYNEKYPFQAAKTGSADGVKK